MANRTIYLNDSYPPLRFQLMQGRQILDLRPAQGIELQATGSTTSFSGPCTSLWPFQPDPNGMNRYNVQYLFNPGDTSTVDTYDLFVIVTWETGVQTFATSNQLSVIAQATP